jgi:transcriptional regulator with XRE-family HTH domain
LDSIGEKLRSAREVRRLSIKEVSKETNITSNYIEALEDEDFEKFPGETYLIGFLRSYAEYLKIDADEIVKLYKGYKIGESATPLEELTKPTRSPLLVTMSTIYNKYKNFFYIGEIAISLFLVILIFSSIFSKNVKNVDGDDKLKDLKNNQAKHLSDIGNYNKLILTNGTGYAIVAKNEGVFFSVDQRDAMFILREIKSKEEVVLEISPGNVIETIEKNKPKLLTIKGCPRDVEFTLNAIAENSAKIKIALGKRLDGDEKDAETAEKPKEIKDSKVIARDEKNLNITFEADFTQKSFIEVYLDGMLKKRGMVPAGTKDRYEASSHIQIRIGNAGGVKIRINGKDYNWGGPGAVANKIITWKKDVSNPNVYHIVIKDW